MVIGQLPEFNPERGDSFSAFVERVQLFFEANGIEEAKQVAVFLSAIGNTAQPGGPSKAEGEDLRRDSEGAAKSFRAKAVGYSGAVSFLSQAAGRGRVGVGLCGRTQAIGYSL